MATGITAALCSAVLLSAVFERGSSFTYDRTTGAEKVYRRVKALGPSNTGVCRCAPDRTERIPLPGGFTTRLSLFDRGGPDQRPGMVVVHGNTWLGSDLSTYRVLAARMADRGFVVAAVDLPGFGKGDDPFRRGPSTVADAYDRPAIVGAAVDWLVQDTDVDPSDITLFGHSGGVDWAMRVGVRHPNVARVAVMVAPPPPEIEGGLQESTPEYDTSRAAYFSRRFGEQYEFVYGKPVPEWYRWELAQPNGRYSDDVFALYSYPGHKPFLLILGERDQPDGHASVRRHFDSVADPKELVVLRDADHYLNTAQALGLVFYDIAVVRQLTDDLAAWIG